MVVFRGGKRKGKKEIPPFFFPFSLLLQRRCCWRRRMRLQRRSPHWTVRGTRGNKTFQVKTGLSICCLLYHGPLPQEADGKPGTERYGSSFPSHDCFWTSLNLCTWIILKSSVMDVIWLFFSPVYLLHGLL